MRILIVGGSSFVGRHITQRAVDAGHEVVLFNRGRTNPGAFAGVEQIQGDRNTDLDRLAGRAFDATIDVCAYVPRQVRSLLETLGSGAGHYAFISTVSVYPETTPAHFDESFPLVAPAFGEEVTNETYGALKVACELVAAELAGERLAIVRPGYVVGPFDPTGRFTYWVERVAAGGRMLGPAADQPLQVIDGRDLAAFTVGLVEAEVTDSFHAAAPDPALSFSEALREVAAGVGQRDLDVEWRGQHDGLPLSDVPDGWGLMQADVSKAVSRGLRWRPLSATSADILEWVTAVREAGTYTDRPGPISRDEEQALLIA